MRLRPGGRREWKRAILFIALGILLSYPLYSWFQEHILLVKGSSMAPTLEDGRYYLSVWEKEQFERGDVVVVEVDDDGDRVWWVKRVIGIEGDTIHVEAGAARILLNGELLNEPYLDPLLVTYDESGTWVVPKGEIFIMGDNRGNSHDSRYVGTLKLESVRIIFGVYFQFW